MNLDTFQNMIESAESSTKETVTRYRIEFLFKSGNCDAFVHGLTLNQVNEVKQAFISRSRILVGDFAVVDGEGLDAFLIKPYTVEVEPE